MRTHSDGCQLEIDFETDNAIIEIKDGRGKGLSRQISDRLDSSVNPSGKVCIGLAWSSSGISPHAGRSIDQAGGLSSSSMSDVVDLIKP